ncbi:hypothetical protein SAMN05421593_2350 [Chryseobacterium culicis]|jgi:hypothetical protein|uniref:Uncharacterized protein n=1 Tax=Chryseobacterium culicis TaxID=680127 RepID=A0A1H6HCG2_CHRCI|nr:hypothetical protein SAMN05421593_2350 [Chryseobacterium culicis]
MYLEALFAEYKNKTASLREAVYIIELVVLN